MTPTHSHDVVVVGASIAGCATATLFARAGARVALVERSPDPNAYKVACTHFLLAGAVPVLDRLGATDRIRAAGAVPNDIHLHTRWGWVRPPIADDFRYPRHGYNVRRSVLDPMLRRMAAETDGVDLFLGHAVEQLLSDGGRVGGVVARTRSGERIELQAPLVVGADGRGSRVADLAELPARVKPHGRFNFFAHYRDLPLATGSVSQMWMNEPDVVYAFPNDDGVTVLCVMPSLDRLPEFKADMRGRFERAFQDLPEGPDLGRGRQVSPIMGKVSMPNVYRRVSAPGVALVGDAALRRYRRRHRARLGGHHFMTSDFSTGRPYNPVERLMFQAAALDGRCADHFAAFGGRSIGVTRYLTPPAVARAAWVVARRSAS